MSSVFKVTRLALTSVLGALIHYSGLEFHFKVKSRGQSTFQSASPEFSPCLHRSQNARGKLKPETFLYLSYDNAWSFGTLSACRSFETKDYYSGRKAPSLKMGSVCFSFVCLFVFLFFWGVDFRSYADWFAAS